MWAPTLAAPARRTRASVSATAASDSQAWTEPSNAPPHTRARPETHSEDKGGQSSRRTRDHECSRLTAVDEPALHKRRAVAIRSAQTSAQPRHRVEEQYASSAYTLVGQVKGRRVSRFTQTFITGLRGRDNVARARWAPWAGHETRW
eukprot:scaffold23947_cov28-Tisochrysis_lutea.AAC.5